MKKVKIKGQRHSKRVTGLAQDNAEKDGGEPMRIIAWTRLSLNRLDTGGSSCGSEKNE